MDDKFTKTEFFDNVKLMLSFVWNGDKALFAYKAIEIIFSTAQMLISTIFLKIILDCLQKREINTTFLITMSLQLAIVIAHTIWTYFGKVIVPQREYKLKNHLQNIFIKKSIQHDLDCYENSEFYDAHTKAARYADSKAIDFFHMCSDLMQQVINIAALFSVIVTLSPVIFIVSVLRVVVSWIDASISGKYSYELYEAEESIKRRADYIKKVAHHKNYAKEVRIYNLGGFLIEKLNKTFKERYDIYKSYNSKYWKCKFIIYYVNNLFVTPLLLVYLIYSSYKGYISIGSFTVLFGISFDVSGAFSEIVNTVSRLNFESRYFVRHLKGILNYIPKIELNLENAKSIEAIETIEFKNVFFKYPSHNNWVLKDVSFMMKKGQKIAIVGENGAGKSTIVKLLLRLYDVTQGEILINGENIKNYDTAQLRKLFAAIFQDYNIYDFSIAENVALSSKYTPDKIQKALEFSDLSDKIDSMEQGVESYVGREFDEKGIELSGGEKQRLAISRAYFHKNNVFIMDEANSALDPLAEYNLNIKIMEKLKEALVVFVTHRLTTTSKSDIIIVLSDGIIIETGNHSQLMDSNGLYAKMYNAQLKGYYK